MYAAIDLSSEISYYSLCDSNKDLGLEVARLQIELLSNSR